MINPQDTINVITKHSNTGSTAIKIAGLQQMFEKLGTFTIFASCNTVFAAIQEYGVLLTMVNLNAFNGVLHIMEKVLLPKAHPPFFNNIDKKNFFPSPKTLKD